MKRPTYTRTSGGSMFAWSLAVAILGAGLPAGAQSTNIALGKPARQSSLSAWSRGDTDAQGGVDGVKNGYFGFHTSQEQNPWWQVDLQGTFSLSEVRVFNRMDLRDRADSLEVLVSTDAINWQSIYRHSGAAFGGFRGGSGDDPLVVRPGGARARYVRLRIADPASTYFHLDEVEVYGTPASTSSPTIRTQKATYAPNEAIVVEFAGLPGNQYDWVSIAKAGAPENQFEAGRWTYVNGEESGCRKFDGLPPGSMKPASTSTGPPAALRSTPATRSPWATPSRRIRAPRRGSRATGTATSVSSHSCSAAISSRAITPTPSASGGAALEDR